MKTHTNRLNRTGQKRSYQRADHRRFESLVDLPEELKDQRVLGHRVDDPREGEHRPEQARDEAEHPADRDDPFADREVVFLESVRNRRIRVLESSGITMRDFRGIRGRIFRIAVNRGRLRWILPNRSRAT